MDFPPAEPWSDLSDEFLADVLAARERFVRTHGDISKTAVARLVRASWPANLQAVDVIPQVDENAHKTLTTFNYGHVVHGRSDLSEERVTDCAFLMLTFLNADQFAKGELNAIVDHGVTNYYVVDGNHRILAQHIVGIGPWGYVWQVPLDLPTPSSAGR